MSEMKELENKNALVLEGMYKGIVGKVEESKSEVSRELQFSAAQQLSSYEALQESIATQFDAVITELKFLSQQNCAIFEQEEKEREENRDLLKTTVEERVQAVEQKIAQSKQEVIDAVRLIVSQQAQEMQKQMQSDKEELLEAIQAIATAAQPDYDEIAQRVKVALTPEEEEVVEDDFDYNLLAEKIVSMLPETDYDAVAEKIAAVLPETDYDVLAERVAVAVPQTDYDMVADKVAAAISPTDYDLIAEKVKEAVKADEEENAEEVVSAEEEISVAEEVVDYDLIAEKVAEKVIEALTVEDEGEVMEDDTFASVVAEKVAEVNAVDYDLIAQKVVEALPAAVEPEAIDYDLVAQKVVSAMPVEDDDHTAALIAAAVMSKLPEQEKDEDCDKLADSVAENVVNSIADQFDLTVDEEGIMRIADAVAGALDYNAIAEKVADLLKGDEGDLVRIVQTVVEEAPVVEEVKAPVEELAVADAEDDREGVVETVNDPSMVTRFKRSFIAKLTQSDETVKDYYSEIKNAFLSYDKVRSQVSWANDRFTKSRETLAKIAIRGKTLCLYLALNPDSFPITVYHQKFAGDTKMYEKTPMMVKIKSGVGLKRALRLINTLMEREEAKKKKEQTTVDYRKMYKYKSDKRLLNEGLIKTAVVAKTSLDF